MLKFCPQCGASVNESQRFCNKCGVSLQPTSPYDPKESPTAQQTYAPPSPSQAPYASPNVGYQPSGAPGAPMQPFQTGPLPSQSPYGQNQINLGLTNFQLSALCYLLPFVGGILALVIEPYNRDRWIRFHAWQSILFMLAWLVIKPIVGFMLKWVLFDGLVGLLSFVAGIGFFCAWIYLMIQTWQGQLWKVPLIGDVAQQQADSTVR
jgi:uncharacterized membrane protein